MSLSGAADIRHTQTETPLPAQTNVTTCRSHVTLSLATHSVCWCVGACVELPYSTSPFTCTVTREVCCSACNCTDCCSRRAVCVVQPLVLPSSLRRPNLTSPVNTTHRAQPTSTLIANTTETDTNRLRLSTLLLSLPCTASVSPLVPSSPVRRPH